MARFERNIELVEAYMKNLETQTSANQLKLYNDLVAISQSLIKTSEYRRLESLRQQLSSLNIAPTRLLSDMSVEFSKITVNKCKTLKSHAKVPIMIHIPED